MAVSTRLRWEILRRDRFACRYCGARALKDGVVLEVDHVLPKVLGGKDRADNLVAACEACNSGKGSTHPDSPLIEDVEADALRWARVVKRAGQKVMADQAALEDLLSEFEEAWDRWGYGDGDERQTVPKTPAGNGALRAYWPAGSRCLFSLSASRWPWLSRGDRTRPGSGTCATRAGEAPPSAPDSRPRGA